MGVLFPYQLTLRRESWPSCSFVSVCMWEKFLSVRHLATVIHAGLGTILRSGPSPATKILEEQSPSPFSLIQTHPPHSTFLISTSPYLRTPYGLILLFDFRCFIAGSTCIRDSAKTQVATFADPQSLTHPPPPVEHASWPSNSI